jgi:hypothetical protein
LAGFWAQPNVEYVDVEGLLPNHEADEDWWNDSALGPLELEHQDA